MRFSAYAGPGHSLTVMGLLLAGVWSGSGCGAPSPVAVGAAPSASVAADDVAPPPPDLARDMRVDALADTVRRPAPVEVRNPFRFGEVAAGGRATPRRGGEQVDAVEQTSPTEALRSDHLIPDNAAGVLDAQPAGDVALRVIGVVAAGGGAGVVAVVAAGRDVWHGQVGEVVGGRYRIAAIDGESVLMERLPGGARQILRRPRS